MRLGDLDALKQELVAEMVKCMRMSEETKGSMAERVLNRVDEAPTIEAEPVKWIPVTERLPEESDADDAMGVYAVHKRSLKRYWHFASVKDNPFDFTYWMPIPQPAEDGGTENV